MKTLSVIAFPGAPNLPVFAAMEQGLFAEAGLDIRFETTPSSVHQFAQFGTGAFDIAFTAFDTAGTTPFANRAAGELRAAGVAASPSRAGSGAAGILTSQELQIAHLAASGMTNREIADRIYLSHRTVAAHLYKVFPKLGITRRNQLHAALGDRADGI